MAPTLATYITLPGGTAEAMTHWHEVFGGDLQILRYGDMALEGLDFEPDPEGVAHATLATPGGVICGGDAYGLDSELPVRDSAYSVVYTSGRPEESRELIAKLVDGGGSEDMPFAIAPWGSWYGQVFDRFGVMWAFSSEA